jgi:hypothetical protein
MSGGGFNDFAKVVVKHGFTITATDGKRPVVSNWQNPNPTNFQWAARMVAKNRYANCNLGIVCGRVVAIDIDAEDAAKAAQLRALAIEYLGSTPFERRGRAPRTLLLYAPAEVEKLPPLKIADCIDVLSGGRQFVAYGIHPDTKQPYRWIDSHYNPATATICDLPVITGAALTAFGVAVCTALGKPLKGLPEPSLQS